MKPFRVMPFAAGALVLGGCNAIFGSSEGGPAASGSATASARGGATAPAFMDDSPPAWVPPDYREIGWGQAAALIRSKKVDRVIATRTRRVYVVDGGGTKYYTAEPDAGDLKALLAEVQGDAWPTFLVHHGDEISWAEAEAHIRSKRASSVSTSHFQMVSLNLRAGGYYFAIAPKGTNIKGLLLEVDPSEKEVQLGAEE